MTKYHESLRERRIWGRQAAIKDAVAKVKLAVEDACDRGEDGAYVAIPRHVEDEVKREAKARHGFLSGTSSTDEESKIRFWIP